MNVEAKNQLDQAQQELKNLFSGAEAVETLRCLKTVQDLALFASTDDLTREDINCIFKLKVISEGLEKIVKYSSNVVLQ